MIFLLVSGQHSCSTAGETGAVSTVGWPGASLSGDAPCDFLSCIGRACIPVGISRQVRPEKIPPEGIQVLGNGGWINGLQDLEVGEREDGDHEDGA